MTPLMTRAQMTALDAWAIQELGLPALVLMEVAGRAVADAAEKLARQGGRPILCLAGTGNNGGDAVVAARHLEQRGLPVALWVIGDPQRYSLELQQQIAIAEKLGIQPMALQAGEASEIVAEDSLGHPVLVDGLFGTGLARPIQGELRRLVETLAERALPTVAVDIPSGVDADTGQVWGAACPATITVTFQHPKPGLLLHPGRALAGEVQVVDIGLPKNESIAAQTFILDDSEIEAAYPPRAADTHKGSYGHLLLVAGSPDKPGSALLAGRAALRAGAGLVTVAAQDETIRRLAPAFEALMGLSLGDTVESPRLLDALARKTALAVGPSLEVQPSTLPWLKALLLAARVPVVIDAGALIALGQDLAWLKDRPAETILTPHPGEAGVLLGLDVPAVQADRLKAARTLAQNSGAEVILKGATTIVASPKNEAALVLRGNPGMSTAGAGDVLTGIVGALLAVGLPAKQAARSAAQLHAKAGDLAAQGLGETALTAVDLIQALAEATRPHDRG